MRQQTVNDVFCRYFIGFGLEVEQDPVTQDSMCHIVYVFQGNGIVSTR
jgi:hypothetical protein